MATPSVALPLDPTGTAASNKITGERQVITPPNGRDFVFIVPELGPFFMDGFEAYHFPSGRLLVEGVDYLFTHRFYEATKALAKGVYGSVTFFDPNLGGVVSMNYQSIGGEWVIDQAKIAKILATTLYNPRVTTWEQVVELPYAFPPIDHEFDTKDLIGMTQLLAKLEQVRATLAESGGEGLRNHIDNHANPHEVSKAQVGLGNVQDFGVANPALMLAGVSTNTYVTPALVRYAIDAIALGPLRAHVENRDNPHQVTKAQIGLDQVPNHPLATLAQAQVGDSSRSLMSAALTKAAIDTQALAPLAVHTSNKNNPHEVNKAQIGLSQVQNFAPSDVAAARAGLANNLYMTPATTREAINAQVFDAVTGHVNDKNNPHQTTKAHVGLGNVQNLPVATSGEAIAGLANDRYMTPARVAEYFQASIGGQTQAHLANRSNPHEVTKAQVGLGDVQNYPTANDTEAAAAVAQNRYVTPAGVRVAIGALVGTLATSHLTDYSNPHRVSKEQLGLGNLSNYSTATNEQTVAAVSQSLFVTPAGAGALVDAKLLSFQSNPLFLAHIADHNNPHQTTKQDVGLGNVQNYLPATLAQAIDAVVDNAYVTPNHLRAFYDMQESTDPVRGQVIAFMASRANPNQVTADQVGLGAVSNWGPASNSQGAAGDRNDLYMTPAATKAAIAAQVVEVVLPPDLLAHPTRNDNPHGVTAAQVGTWTIAQIQAALAAKLDANQPANDSVRLGGQTVSQLLADASREIPLEKDEWTQVSLWSVATASPLATEKKTGLLTVLSEVTGVAVPSHYLLALSPNGPAELTPIGEGGALPTVFVTSTPVAGSNGAQQDLACWIHLGSRRGSLLPLVDPNNRLSLGVTSPTAPTGTRLQTHYGSSTGPVGKGEVVFGSVSPLDARLGAGVGERHAGLLFEYAQVLPAANVAAAAGLVQEFITDDMMPWCFRTDGARRAGQWSEATDKEVVADMSGLMDTVPHPMVLMGATLTPTARIEVDFWATSGKGLIGVALLQPRGNGWTGFYALRGLGNQVDFAASPESNRIRLLTVGQDLLQPSSNIIQSLAGTLQWGDGVVNTNRVPSTFDADVNGWTLAKKARLRLHFDGAVFTISTSQLGATAFVNDATLTVPLTDTSLRAGGFVPALVVAGQTQANFTLLAMPGQRLPVLASNGSQGKVWDGLGWATPTQLLQPGRTYYDPNAQRLWSVRRNGVLRPIAVSNT